MKNKTLVRVDFLDTVAAGQCDLTIDIFFFVDATFIFLCLGLTIRREIQGAILTKSRLASWGMT